MKRNRIALAAVGLLAAGAIALAGCSGGSGKKGGAASEGKTDSAAIITANGSEPQNPLIPTNTNETGGGKILDSIFAGLVYYDGKGKPVNDMAESITTNDPQNLTVKLKKGQKFTDGTEVKADNFIKAWNYGALASNKQLSSYFFEDIVGYNAETDSALTGLKKVDDYTFTIALSKPAADFALRLGYSAFFPLPEAAFADMAKFGKNPIGNGPYKIGGKGWQNNVQIDLVKNPDYQGGRKAKNGGLTLKFYASLDAAYADLRGNKLDVLDQLPATALPTYQKTLGDRAVNQPGAVFQSFTIGQFLPRFSGEEGKLRRAALSMAFDRKQITEKIFFKTRTPAADFTSPSIAGWSNNIPGNEVLKYDPKKAKELWAKANKIAPWSGKFQIAYNSDGGHKEWVDAVTNSIKNTLGIDASGAPYPTFAQIRTEITNRTIKTAARSGWQADYPGMYNFLGPIYATGAGSNDGDYSNPEFDKTIAKGIGNTDAKGQLQDFKKAQQILFQDLPAIPLWYQNTSGGFSTLVQDVTFGWNSVPLYYQITKAAK